MQKEVINQYNNKLEKELIKLFHSSGLPLHFNKTGNKEFTNYQRVCLIILFQRSKKSLRDFVEELKESKWVSWLGLKKIPKKSTLHIFLIIFILKIFNQSCKVLLPKEMKLTAIDGTGFDSWQRSRHYERKLNRTQMPYAKVDLFADVRTRKILDFNLTMKKEHDVKIAEKIFRRCRLKEVIILADKGYDSEPLHEVVRQKGGILFAPLRKMSKKSTRNKTPKGFYRRQCIKLPDFMGQRSIIEAINYSLKKKQIIALSSKKKFMKQRELGWHVIWYNLRMNLKNSIHNEQSFLFFRIEFFAFPDMTA